MKWDWDGFWYGAGLCGAVFLLQYACAAGQPPSELRRAVRFALAVALAAVAVVSLVDVDARLDRIEAELGIEAGDVDVEAPSDG